MNGRVAEGSRDLRFWQAGEGLPGTETASACRGGQSGRVVEGAATGWGCVVEGARDRARAGASEEPRQARARGVEGAATGSGPAVGGAATGSGLGRGRSRGKARAGS
ncbi:hypothetical protein A4R44_06194 [Amycolatopsis sp. M39]|nr:hypothetical protein A4R44_06194 [Amycolatopsis sp. M39]